MYSDKTKKNDKIIRFSSKIIYKTIKLMLFISDMIIVMMGNDISVISLTVSLTKAINMKNVPLLPFIHDA